MSFTIAGMQIYVVLCRYNVTVYTEIQDIYTFLISTHTYLEAHEYSHKLSLVNHVNVVNEVKVIYYN